MQQKNTVTKYSDRIAGYNPEALSVFSFSDIRESISLNRKKITDHICTIKNLIDTPKKEYRRICELQEQTVKLFQELRQVASIILRDSLKTDECPLCHTPFAPGELVKRIKIGVDDHFEVTCSKLTSQIQELEARLSKVSAEQIALIWLEGFCEQAGLSSDTSISSIISEVEKTKQILDAARIRIEALEREMQELKSQGFSARKFDEMLEKLCDLGFPQEVSSKEALDNLLSAIDKKIKVADQNLHFENIQIKKLQRSIDSTLGLIGIENKEMRGIISNLNEKLLISDRIRMKMNAFFLSFPWPNDRPIAELLVDIESIRKVSAELQKALQKEKQTESTCSEGIKRKEEITKKLKDLKPRIERLSKAEKILAVLKKEYSLNSAMEAALQENRSSIESIFSRIHSPAEFIGIGPSLETLVRKGSNQEASLSEISTGQRAAFALSIFLAQNANICEAAPPVILIDDPIAHIDDLNSLSFLDYLREIALSGKKQIFFSTASNKLATLFERKFDFLGSDKFKKFNLERPQLSIMQDISE